MAEGGWERTRYPGIFKRSGPRGTRYKVKYRDSESIQRTQNFATLDAARGFKAELRVKKDRGETINPAQGRVLVGAFWTHFMRVADIRPSTRARYETHGKLYILPRFGKRQLRNVTRADVNSFFADLRAKDTGVPTIQSVYRLLHRLFQAALEEDRIGRNPVTGVHVSGAQRREPRFLTESEVRSIAERTSDPYRTLIYFLAYTGLRIGEATALRMKNVDMGARIIRVVENAPEVAGKKIVGPTKTRRARMVHFGPHLKKMLESYVSSYRKGSDAEALVFVGPLGAPIRQNGFRRRIFQKAAREARVQPTPTVHDLRHTAASLMAKAGFSMQEAAEQLGHSYTAMTAQYSHVFPRERERKVAELDRLMTA